MKENTSPPNRPTELPNAELRRDLYLKYMRELVWTASRATSVTILFALVASLASIGKHTATLKELLNDLKLQAILPIALAGVAAGALFITVLSLFIGRARRRLVKQVELLNKLEAYYTAALHRAGIIPRSGERGEALR